MRKKALFGLLAVPLAFLLSSCFVLQGFWIKSNSIPAGGKGTKAVFQLHPSKYATGDNGYQFFLVGVVRLQRSPSDEGDLGNEWHFRWSVPAARLGPTRGRRDDVGRLRVQRLQPR